MDWKTDHVISTHFSSQLARSCRWVMEHEQRLLEQSVMWNTAGCGAGKGLWAFPGWGVFESHVQRGWDTWEGVQTRD